MKGIAFFRALIQEPGRNNQKAWNSRWAPELYLILRDFARFRLTSRLETVMYQEFGLNMEKAEKRIHAVIVKLHQKGLFCTSGVICRPAVL